jgi:hypothetical protein
MSDSADQPTPTNVLFYGDVLGMKARWALGVHEIKAAYRQLEALVEETLLSTETVSAAQGGVQSDAVALTFDTVDTALRFGRALFARLFQDASEDGRFWMRGLLVPCAVPGNQLTFDVPLASAPCTGVSARHFCDELLGAVNLEQGFKGPRLLISEELITSALREATRLPLGERFIIPLRRLDYSSYPAANLWDVLYLLPDPLTDEAISNRGGELGRLQRWASVQSQSGSREEFEHVSHLVLTWTQCDAMYRSIVNQQRHD